MSPTESDTIVVSFGVDTKFVPHMAAVIASIVSSAPDARFRFLILHMGVDPARRAQAERVAPMARFDWIELREDEIPEFRDRAHFSRATLFRLGLERVAPADCGRVIYLDADLIVLRDLRALWQVDLGTDLIAAVTDTFFYDPGYPAAFAQRWGLDFDKGQYINAGVLLLDLEKIRAEKGFTRAISIIQEHGESLPFNDQDAINIVFWGRCKILGNEWNASRERVVTELAASLPPDKRLDGRAPAIVHFTDKQKPWHKGLYHPWSWLYWRYLARTPFVREVAAAYGVDPLTRARLWLRWLKRRPKAA